MLRAVHDPDQIERCQTRLRKCIREGLRTSIPNVVIGNQGSHISSDVVGNNTVWFAYQTLADEPVPRHWNAFGAGQPALGRSNAITVEVNVASPWAGKRIAGLFARNDTSGDVLLLHRGAIGGSREGVGKAQFTAWYQANGAELVTFLSPNGKNESAFLVADLQQDQFLTGLESFVDAVRRFKSLHKGENPTLVSVSDADLEDRAAHAPERPKSSTTASVVYARNPAVAELAKRRAGGRCELCRQPAPFTNVSNEPYLESHHIVWLAHGGSDRPENTVALCPNCHRKMHVLNHPTDVERLLRRARVRYKPS